MVTFTIQVKQRKLLELGDALIAQAFMGDCLPDRFTEAQEIVMAEFITNSETDKFEISCTQNHKFIEIEGLYTSKNKGDYRLESKEEALSILKIAFEQMNDRIEKGRERVGQ